MGPARRGLAVAAALSLALAGCAPGEGDARGTAVDAPASTSAARVSTSDAGAPLEMAAPSTSTARDETGPDETGPDETTATVATDDGELTVAFVGDIMLARSIGERIVRDGPQAPLAGVREELRGADITVGNLETTLGTEGRDGTAEPKAYTFMAPPPTVATLLDGGFDVVTVANNHAYDFGATGLQSTIDVLDEAGIGHIGAGADRAAAHAPLVVEEEGIRVAFLGYVDVPDDWTGYRNRGWAAGPQSPGVAWADPEVIAADVQQVSERVDHVVVLLHAGLEESEQPDETQRAAASAALQAGATAVIGAHPHVLQGYRLEDARLVAWSLGNFVFDGFSDTATTQSVVLNVRLDDTGVAGLEWVPVRLVDGFPQVVAPDSVDGRAVLDRLERLSS